MKQPHDNWSVYYDFVYERTFGSFYHKLTSDTLESIYHIIQKGNIADYGAGTGRLCIPLKEKGFDVIAVEKSAGMVNELKKKQKLLGLEFPVYNTSISNYKNGKSDLALALFTILSYSITKSELKANVHNICFHLNSRGYFFFDLPSSVFFSQGQLINIKSEDLNRSVSIIKSKQKNIFTYHEKCSGLFEGKNFKYEDKFLIRYWEIEFVDHLLRKEGLIPVKKDFSHFNATGSTYKLYKKV